MSCSPEYMALVKTASGLTPDKPYGKLGSASPGAYAEWRVLAGRLADAANERLTKLGDVEAARIAAHTLTTFKQYNEFGLGARGLEDEARDLPTSFEDASTQALVDGIANAKNVAVDAAILIERIDYAMLYYGSQPPPLFGLGQAAQTTSNPSGLGVLGTVGAFVVIGLAAAGMVYLVRKSRGGSSPVEVMA